MLLVGIGTLRVAALSRADARHRQKAFARADRARAEREQAMLETLRQIARFLSEERLDCNEIEDMIEGLSARTPGRPTCDEDESKNAEVKVTEIVTQPGGQ